MPTLKLLRDGSSPILRTVAIWTVATAVVVCCRQTLAQQPKPATEESKTESKEPKAESADKPAAPPAAAKPKGFQQLAVDDSQRKMRLPVMQMLRARKFESGRVSSTGEEQFDGYYKRYALPRWTQKKNHTLLPALRKELRNDLLTGKSGPPHDRLNALSLDYLGKMSRANLHPVVRFNAMLMIGDLNARQPTGRNEPGVALPEALPALLETLEDEKQIEAVKVAALIGIIRHARLEITNEQSRNQMIGAMLKLATAKSAPGRSSAGHAWMRCQAIEALAALGTIGSQGTVVKTLVGIIAEPGTPLSLRCTAAWAIGQLKYQSAGGLDLKTMVTQLGTLAADICAAEFKRLEEEIPRAVPKRGSRYPRAMGTMGGGMDMMGGEFGMGMGMGSGARNTKTVPLEKLLKASRRSLMARLDDVVTGFQAITRIAAGSPQEALVTELQKKLEEVLTFLEDSDLDEDEESLVDLLKEEHTELRALLANDSKAKKSSPKKASDG